MIKPLGQRVLVKRCDVEKQTEGGLFLPDNVQKKQQEAIVVLLGTGARDENGKLIDFTVKENDRVLVSPYGGTEVKNQGQDYVIVNEQDILGIIEETNQ